MSSEIKIELISETNQIHSIWKEFKDEIKSVNRYHIKNTIDLKKLAKKDVPEGIKYHIVKDTVLPKDRTFRDAWTYTAGSDEKTSADLSAEDLAKYNMTENK